MKKTLLAVLSIALLSGCQSTGSDNPDSTPPVDNMPDVNLPIVDDSADRPAILPPADLPDFEYKPEIDNGPIVDDSTDRPELEIPKFQPIYDWKESATWKYTESEGWSSTNESATIDYRSRKGLEIRTENGSRLNISHVQSELDSGYYVRSTFKLQHNDNSLDYIHHVDTDIEYRWLTINHEDTYLKISNDQYSAVGNGQSQFKVHFTTYDNYDEYVNVNYSNIDGIKTLDTRNFTLRYDQRQTRFSNNRGYIVRDNTGNVTGRIDNESKEFGNSGYGKMTDAQKSTLRSTVKNRLQNRFGK